MKQPFYATNNIHVQASEKGIWLVAFRYEFSIYLITNLWHFSISIKNKTYQRLTVFQESYSIKYACQGKYNLMS